MDKYKIAKKVSLVTIVLNVILAIFKMIAGIVGKSNAMIADGLHTLSDVVTTVVVLVGIKIAMKDPDKNHPYGHEKYESIFAKLLSMLLIITGIFIGYESVKLVISQEFTKPGNIALVAALLSVVVKELMYHYTKYYARKIKSVSMEADAWHHRSDAFSSIGTFLGVLGAKLGFPVLDPIAGVVVSVLIVKVGVDLYKESVKGLVDESADEETVNKLKEAVENTSGVIGIKNIKTRMFGSRIYVDIEILVDGTISVKEGHDIAETVHDKVESSLEDVKHCMVHVEPY